MLRISNLSFDYHGRTILQNINLSFLGSERVALIGDNGAGKTTLLQLIAGELQPSEGAIESRGDVGLLHQTQADLADKSGGERTRIKLAELFRAHPEILLLDEPTNNLDGESRAWLLENLQKYRGLILFVSHDRGFINQLAEKVLYLHDGEIEIFHGNYQDFRARQTQLANEQALRYETIQREKKKLAKQLKVANDHAHKSNRRAFNKIKDESKLINNGKRMGAQNSAGKTLRALKSKLDQLGDIQKPSERKTYQAQVLNNLSHDKKILQVTNLSKTYGRELFSGLDFDVRTGERIRIAGRNGSGKSTLFKIIMNEVSADAGEIWQTPEIQLEYISQDKISLDPDTSFLEQSSELDKTKIYQAASTMDFTAADLQKPIKALSRGQMTKMAILKLILQPQDLVILDEITNHLDIRARENIENALKNYHGAMLVATHDEAFASALEFEKEINL